MTVDRDCPEERRVYRYTVEVTEVQSRASRTIPLEAYQLIRLSRKDGAAGEPPVEIVRFRDGDFLLEARSFEELRDRLRAHYPDEQYERRLHVQRDRDAEERRERALLGLIEILARAAVDEYFRGMGPDGVNA
jgi:hypothetical protein